MTFKGAKDGVRKLANGINDIAIGEGHSANDLLRFLEPFLLVVNLTKGKCNIDLDWESSPEILFCVRDSCYSERVWQVDKISLGRC